jgi:hypothetical protein
VKDNPVHAIAFAPTIALTVLLAMSGGVAAKEAPSPACDEQGRALASRFLIKSHLDRDIVTTEPSVQDCKVWPGREHLDLAVFIYDTPINDEKRMLVALVDLNKDRIVASYWTKVDADATTPYHAGSVTLDTAAYHLKPGVRAFGIDVETRTSAAQESGGGPERTLYVREGSQIRPVLQRMSMARWEYINGYQPYLNTEDSPRPVTEEFTYTISIAPSVHNGYADLRITRRSSEAKHRPVSQLLRYDGRQYPTPNE